MIKLIARYFALLLVIVHSGSCAPSSRLERARNYEQKEKYEEAIREASSPEALTEDAEEAKKIISRSMKAKMFKDIELAWTLSDEELKKRGIIVARDCFRNDVPKSSKGEQDGAE